MATDSIKQRVRSLEKRLAKLEKAAVLFEEHRQSWIILGKGLKKMKKEMDRDRRKEDLARDSYLQTLRPVSPPLLTAMPNIKRVPLKVFEGDVEAVFREAEQAPVMITKGADPHLVVLSISAYRRLSPAPDKRGAKGD